MNHGSMRFDLTLFLLTERTLLSVSSINICKEFTYTPFLVDFYRRNIINKINMFIKQGTNGLTKNILF